jgi:hypothetical protein
MISGRSIVNGFHSREDKLTTAMVRIILAFEKGILNDYDRANFQEKRNELVDYLEDSQRELHDAVLQVLIDNLKDEAVKFEAAIKIKSSEIKIMADRVVETENEILLYLINKFDMTPSRKISLVTRIAMVEKQLQKAS